MDPALLASIDFGDQGAARWHALAAKALKGADVDASLTSHSDDGIAMFANNERVESPGPLFSRAREGWAVVQRIDDRDVNRAARQAKEDIAGGATGLSLVFEGAESAHGYGLPANEQTIAAILDDIALDGLTLRMEPHPRSRLSAEWLADYLRARKPNMARLQLSLGIDLASVFAATGRLKMTLEALEASLPQSLSGFFAAGLPGVLLEADGRVYHNAGATEAQELGAVLSVGASHLRMFETARQPVGHAAKHIGFALAVDQDQFLATAKLRALRVLWQRLLEVSGIKEQPRPAIHAETSWRMLALKDAETNILRSGIAVFAAATGGADSISVLPHTFTHGLPAPFARRVARNTQLVLRDEARISFVDDPSAGAGAIEALTDSLCEAAWAEFRQIEIEGGMFKSLSNGHFQRRVRAAKALREDHFAAKSRMIIGTTLFPLADDRAVETLPAAKVELVLASSVFCDALLPVRIAEHFEGSTP